MKLLILSCNTGGGHNAAAHALAKEAEKHGHDVTVLDMMLLSGEHTSRLIGGLYLQIVTKIPAFFGFIYRLGMLISNRYVKSPVYLANARLGEKLQNYIEENHFDAVLTTHLYPAETITWLKHHNRFSVPSVAVCTDYTCIPFWEETDCDFYILPHEDLTGEFVSRGIPRKKLLPFGIPVDENFCIPKDPAAARSHFRLPAGVPVYLIMSGSMGFGRLAVFAEALVHHCTKDEHIIIVCGNNKKIYSILKHQFRRHPNVHILGYTRQVALLMDACDVLFTKPGGLTSTEALVKQIATVHTAPIPGCETKNCSFFNGHGISCFARSIPSQIRLGCSLAHDPALSSAMRQKQSLHRKPDAAYRIISLLEELTGCPSFH